MLDLNYIITLSLEFYCYYHSDHSLCMFPFNKYISVFPSFINPSFENIIIKTDSLIYYNSTPCIQSQLNIIHSPSPNSHYSINIHSSYLTTQHLVPCPLRVRTCTTRINSKFLRFVPSIFDELSHFVRF